MLAAAACLGSRLELAAASNRDDQSSLAPLLISDERMFKRDPSVSECWKSTVKLWAMVLTLCPAEQDQDCSTALDDRGVFQWNASLLRRAHFFDVPACRLACLSSLARLTWSVKSLLRLPRCPILHFSVATAHLASELRFQVRCDRQALL